MYGRDLRSGNVEKLADKPYGEALKERIASKIGLNDTYRATEFVF